MHRSGRQETRRGALLGALDIDHRGATGVGPEQLTAPGQPARTPPSWRVSENDREMMMMMMMTTKKGCEAERWTLVHWLESGL